MLERASAYMKSSNAHMGFPAALEVSQFRGEELTVWIFFAHSDIAGHRSPASIATKSC